MRKKKNRGIKYEGVWCVLRDRKLGLRTKMRKRGWEESKSSTQCAPVEAKNFPGVNQFLGERKVEIRRSRAIVRWVVAFGRVDCLFADTTHQGVGKGDA
jgi:hypothetical protein